MRIRHLCEGAERTVEIESRLEDYTVADLIAALGSRLHEPADMAAGVSIDGCWHGPETPLSSVPIWEGALLEIAPGSGQSPSQSPQRQAGPAPAGRSPDRVLVVTAGLRAGTRLSPPPTGGWVIGRSEGCDVVLDDSAVSRRHARVSVDGPGGRPVIGDLGSRNGTVVAGRAVTAPAPVPARATVRLGATCLQWRNAVDDAPAAVRAGLGAAAGRIPFKPPASPPAPYRASDVASAGGASAATGA